MTARIKNMARSIQPDAWIAVGLAVLLTCAYLLIAWRQSGLGFPLDDAWIHQTYARILASSGQWAFLPGQPSAGSTSPFWTLLQAPGHLLHISPVLWSGALGVLCLLTLAASGAAVWSRLEPPPNFPAWLPTVILIAEWHMIWAALSGMETLLAAVLPVVTAMLLLQAPRRPLLIGAALGVGLWIRPDLVSLALMVAWWELAGQGAVEHKVRSLITVAAGLALLAVPYILFQLILSGEVWPSTFYAKQAEYAVRREHPVFLRYLEQWRAPLAGPLALLAPGCLFWLLATIRDRDWPKAALLMWPAVYLAAFAVRLPVTYQHGRYAMPAIPLLMLTGMLGWGQALRAIPKANIRWIALRAWLLSLAAVAAAFLALGARAYATDVGVIETEMVAASLWLSENTDRDALIAAHDIGALGYYGDRQIVDLAGLVSPEVIPFLRDEDALASHLNSRGADYLMTFPSWYPYLTDQAVLIYVTGNLLSPALGGENMAIYRWVR